MKHIPAREVRYMTREFWWCDGLLHKHLSLAAAEKCERNPDASNKWGQKRNAPLPETSSGQ